MTRLLKKSDRLNVLNSYFENLTKNGYTQETYKDLNIFSKQERENAFLLKIYIGTSTNHVHYVQYKTIERVNQIISQFKESADLRAARKAEEKANKNFSTAANCAKAVREELKLKFPYCKFSVTSDNFSGGNAVRISWENGPTDEQVSNIVNRYEYGHFDGMEDIYKYSNTIENLPQVKYITTSRTISEDLTNRLEIDFKKFYNNEDANDFDHWSVKNVVRRMLYKNEIVNADNIKGWKLINDSGLLEDCYSFLLINEDQPAPAPAETTTTQQTEIEAGSINIIDYSEKAIAVIGETKPIKELLKSLGGSFNPRLSCGCGWIFSKNKLEEVQNALIEFASKNEPKEEAKTEFLALPAHEETTLKDEIQKTVQFFADYDLKNIGEITESTKEIAKIQNIKIIEEIQDNRKHKELDYLHPLNICDPQGGQYKQALKEYEAEKVQQYTNIKSITEAAKSGKQINLLNLSNIINNKTINA